MTAFALTLVLAAAALHAVWNYCAKRAGGGLPFVWIVGVVICAGYLPVLTVYVLWQAPTLPPGSVAWILGSGLLKTSYSLFLQRGYRTGDFSLIYPLARGTGPLLSTFAAIVLLGERPSGLAFAGGLTIVAGIFHLTGGTGKLAALFARRPRPGDVSSTSQRASFQTRLFSSVNYGIASGVFIAAYTVWDRHGVATLRIPPVLYDGGTAFTQLALLTPFALRRRAEVAHEWREHKRWIFGVALLSPLAYILILTAMTFTPVSYIAPAREISIVIGAFLGARLLNEGQSRRRLLAAGAIAIGVIALALG